MTHDVLIIGGGIAGLSVAARLSHLGSVLVLEAEDSLGYHASGRSAAMFEETYGKPATRVLNTASKAHHMHAQGGVLSPRGLMLVALQGETGFDTERAHMEMRELSLPEARALVPILNPDTVARIGHRSDAWDIDTDLMLQNFTREARSNGATIATGQKVTAITKTTHWQVTTATTTYTATILINAAGAWADPLAGLAGVRPMGITPLRRSMARLKAPGGHDTRPWPMMFGLGESWYAKPDAGGLLVSPADEDPMPPQDAWPDDMVLAEGLARYEARMTEPVTRPIATWAGLRSFAPDRELVIGFAPDAPDFFWLAGQGGYGMQTAPAASQLAADLIAARPPEIDAQTVQALSPARFGL